MSICTTEITKALESQTGVPIDWSKVPKTIETACKRDTSCLPYALSPHPELNEELPENLDDLVVFTGRHFGE